MTQKTSISYVESDWSDKGRVKIYRVPGPGPSTGGEDFFSKKIRAAETFFRKKLGGRKLFLLQNLKIQNFIFQKKDIFEVIYVG